jgi:hypothetical protein
MGRFLSFAVGRIFGSAGVVIGAPDIPAVSVFIGEDRNGAPDHGVCRECAEIATVETVGMAGIQEEEFGLSDDVAALPNGQVAAEAIAWLRLRHGGVVDSDSGAIAADTLSGKRRDVLEEGYAFGQITALVEIDRK